MQNRMLAQGPLHRTDGILSEAGYALAPIKDYDRGRVKAPRRRIKEWDYYLVTSPRCALAITVSDNGYMGLDSLSLIDFETLSQRTVSRMNWMPLGKRGLPASSLAGVTRAVGKNYEFTFRVEAGQRQLYGHMYDFGAHKDPLLFDIVLQEPRQDSMVIVTPFHKKPRQFYYNRKISGLPAEGRVIYQDREYLFSPATSFGTLDWGRGVWPYHNTWYWGSASGQVDGVPFGWNIGYGFGNTSAASENVLFYNGRAHKLSQVKFNIPGGERDFMSPWTFTSDDGRFEMDFVPVLDRAACTDVMLIKSDQHQVFGMFTGKAVLDDGTVIEVRDFPGFAEKVENKW